MVLSLSFRKTIKSEDGPRHDIHQVSRGCTTSDGPDSCTLQVNSNGTVRAKHCHHTCLGLVQHFQIAFFSLAFEAALSMVSILWTILYGLFCMSLNSINFKT